jgi:hypothetical protein
MSDERRRGFVGLRLDGDAARRPADRGQTVLDFVVGMSVFLIAVGFTFAFVPSLLEPFTAGEGAKVIVAERGAAHLVETSLSAGAPSAALHAGCTREFFGGDAAADACAWDHDAAALNDELGVRSVRGLNVTVTSAGAPVGIDADGAVAPADTVDETAGAAVLTGGPAPPPSASVSAGSRIVDLDGETYRLTLRVW